MRFHRPASLLVLLGALCPAPRAFAQAEKAPSAPTEGEVELAKKLYREGKDLREKGELMKSLDKLKAAHDLVPTPITRLEYAQALILLGSLVEGHALARSASTMPREPGESDKANRARDEAKKLAARVDGRIPRLVLTVGGDDATPDHGGARLELDGNVVEPGELGKPMPINPGEHTITVVAPASTRTERFRIDEAETRTIAIATNTPSATEASPPAMNGRPTRRAPASPASPSPKASAPAAPKDERSSTSPLVPVGFVLGAVGVTTGAITGTVALVAADKVKDNCRNLRCPPAYHADLDLSTYMGTTATIAFVVGGVGLAVGTIAVFVDGGDPEPAITLAPIVGPGFAGIGGGF